VPAETAGISRGYGARGVSNVSDRQRPPPALTPPPNAKRPPRPSGRRRPWMALPANEARVRERGRRTSPRIRPTPTCSSAPLP